MKNTNTNHSEEQQKKHLNVLRAACDAWLRGGKLRANRRRNKRFTYGNQWGDTVIDDNGFTISEYELMERNGTHPITNNLIRQLVKSIVGRFRNRHTNDSIDSTIKHTHDNNFLDELDARALEEFLISGCCVQRVDNASTLCHSEIRVSNVPIDKFFINNISDVRNCDCEIVGMLHDLSVAELLRLTSGGSREKAAWIRSLYSNDAEARTINLATQLGNDINDATQFWHATGNKCRAIEVWTLESREVLVCHDLRTASLFTVPYDKQLEVNDDYRHTRWDIEQVWHCRWFSPMGDLLTEYDSPFSHGKHPFVVKMYPLTDGEVHSLVEDVIDQQKYVNRLVTLIDRIMTASAKGVLLFPIDALPEGFTWQNIREMWRSCDGVLPFNGDNKPQQVVSNGSNAGAYDMIGLQMKLFEYISGVSGALQGRTADSRISASLYQSQIENSDIALGDVFATFETFLQQRNKKILALTKINGKFAIFAP